MQKVNEEQPPSIPSGKGAPKRSRKVAATPPRKNPLSCGCGIKGTPYLDPIGSRGYEYKDLFIDFCSLHAAAPALLAALQEVERYHDPEEEGFCECTSSQMPLDKDFVPTPDGGSYPRYRWRHDPKCWFAKVRTAVEAAAPTQ